MIAGRLVTLLDGRQVDSASEEWRHEAEARMVAARPTLDQRREYLDAVERRRGKASADALRATMSLLWQARKSPTG